MLWKNSNTHIFLPLLLDYHLDSQKGFVAKEEMPQYLSLLFRAKNPMAPIPSMLKPSYRSLEPLHEEHRSLEEIFEQAKARHYADGADNEFGR